MKVRRCAHLRCQVSIPKVRVLEVGGLAGIAWVGALWV